MPRRRFKSLKNANSFAAKVDGKVNDLREVKGAKSPFTVTYVSTDRTRAHAKTRKRSRRGYKNMLDGSDWSPEEGRDFGYSNEYWK